MKALMFDLIPSVQGRTQGADTLKCQPVLPPRALLGTRRALVARKLHLSVEATTTESRERQKPANYFHQFACNHNEYATSTLVS